MKGRKPKPTVLRALDGNAGKRPINKNEPIPEGDLSAPPQHLTVLQKIIWKHAILNAPRGLLRILDSNMLMIWVIASDLHQQAARKIEEEGLIITTVDKETKQQSPYLAIVNKQAEIMLRSASELGFSPTSRSRIMLGSLDSKKSLNRFSNHVEKNSA
jgi:P27 family predicted phage terminase small subunit